MSVAIRTATRIQDQNDFGSTPGAGNDGYALCWDNDTAKFVLLAMSAGVTDHGALTGLSDDDHSQYLLATGARTGASSQAQTFTNGVVLPDGALAAPALQFSSNTKVGIYYAPNGMAFSLGSSGAYSITFDSSAMSTSALAARFAFGSAAAPAFSFSADNNTGMYRGTNGDELGFATGGTARIFILSTGLVGIGTTSPATQLHALTTDAVTNAVTNVVTVGHNTSGTAAAGFGGGLAFNLQSSTTASQSAAAINAVWTDATHATRTSKLVFQSAKNGTLTDVLSLSTSGISASQSYESGLGAYQFNNLVTQTISVSNVRLALTAAHNTTVSQNATNVNAILDKAGAGRLAGVATAIHGYAFISGNGQVDNLRGMWGSTGKTGSGNVLTASAGYFALAFGNGGTVTSAIGVAIVAPSPGTTTMTTLYGLLVEDQTGGGTNYAIYTGRGDVRLMSSTTDKIGFHGATPVAQQVLATGAGASADDIITALQNLGLVKQS